MSKVIIISNRLPVTVKKTDEGLEFNKSIGGLATGLKSYHEHGDGIWVGWPGISDNELKSKDTKEMKKILKENYKCIPVMLSEEDIDEYYYGFSNETIWPLFHYFTNKTTYNPEHWDAYNRVNRKFFEAVEEHIEDGDIVWVHDYQLMLLPEIIKKKYPNTRVGFFLHIPFPSFETFRLLIWREEILKGILGADLIGFHTYDYVRHFLSSTRRLLGLEHHLNKIIDEDRIIKVDVFPMGIDYDWFTKKIDDSEFNKDVKEIVNSVKDTQMILSIDRLDYTKGIPERIKAYQRFLTKYPEYQEKVKLNLIVAPSRVEVETYDQLRREIDILVSEVNGQFGTVSWMPIWFFFQTFPQESLKAFYRHADLLLVTPLRDGMNLVVKEYIATRTDYKGMVVISETTGAASELGETVVVNPNDCEAIADGIKLALEMEDDEKVAINKIIHKRLKRYNVEFWAEQFVKSLQEKGEEFAEVVQKKDIEKDLKGINEDYVNSKKRLLFLDYDGTLVGFKSIPEKAKPDKELKRMLKELAADTKNTVVIISGRDHYTLDKWLGDLDVHIMASHGLWLRHPNEEWTMTVSVDNEWKESIYHMLEMYTDRMPGSLIEEKDYSLAFHYRQCEPDMIETKLGEVKEAILSMTQSMNLALQEGNKVLEVKDNRVNKGQGATSFLQHEEYDFILGVGDDYTDEDLFAALPEDAYSIKIGLNNTKANYRIKSYRSMRNLLKRLLDNK